MYGNSLSQQHAALVLNEKIIFAVPTNPDVWLDMFDQDDINFDDFYKYNMLRFRTFVLS